MQSWAAPSMPLLGQWLSALRRRKGLAALIVFAVPFALVILAQGPGKWSIYIFKIYFLASLFFAFRSSSQPIIVPRGFWISWKNILKTFSYLTENICYSAINYTTQYHFTFNSLGKEHWIKHSGSGWLSKLGGSRAVAWVVGARGEILPPTSSVRFS